MIITKVDKKLLKCEIKRILLLPKRINFPVILLLLGRHRFSNHEATHTSFKYLAVIKLHKEENTQYYCYNHLFTAKSKLPTKPIFK